MTDIDRAIDILSRTDDGEDLAPEHLYLVELAANGRLSERGREAFADLYANVAKPEGYTRPWLHGIEGLTKDHQGFVRWRGRVVEHYSFSGEGAAAREREAALALADRLRLADREAAQASAG